MFFSVLCPNYQKSLCKTKTTASERLHTICGKEEIKEQKQW